MKIIIPVLTFVLGIIVALIAIEVGRGGIVGPLRHIPPIQAQEESNALIQAIKDAAQDRQQTTGQCPRTDEHTRFINEMKERLDTDYDPSRSSVSQLRSIWKRFNRDSLLRPSGYELWDLSVELYEHCTGQKPPIVERLPNDHVRHQCFYQVGDRLESKQVVGPRQVNIMEICGLDAK